MYDHYPDWIVTVQSPVDAPYEQPRDFHIQRGRQYGAYGPKWDIVSAGHWLEHFSTDMVSYRTLFSIASSLYVFYTILNAFSASCLTAFCELSYTICITINLHYQKKTVLSYV